MIDLSQNAVAVHRLVQAVLRAAAITDKSAGGIQKVAIHLLAAAAPDDPSTNVAGWARWAALVPHIDALSDHLPADHQDATTLNLRSLAATYRLNRGHVAAAIIEYERLLTDTRRLLGPDHPHTLTTRNNLANAYRSAGRTNEAIPLQEGDSSPGEVDE